MDGHTNGHTDGRVALVTGGAHRLGRALVGRLASRGYRVAFTYHTAGTAAHETEAAVRAAGGRADAHRCDLGDPAQVAALAATLLGAHGGLDALIHNASRFEQTPFPGADPGSWARVLGVSVTGPAALTGLLAPALRARGGSIVSILDLSAGEPWPGHQAHAAGKAGLLSLTRQWALELAPVVRANALTLGPILPGQEGTEEARDRAAAGTLLGRWGHPDDVADGLEFLLGARFVTGAEIHIDGGQRLAHLRAARFGA